MLGLIALAVFAACVAAVGRPIVIRDSFAYNASALRLLNTGVYEYNPDLQASIETATPGAFTVPGYTLFLAAIHALRARTGDVVGAILTAQSSIIAVQLLLAAGLVMLICAAGWRIRGRGIGWTAGALAVSYLPFGLNASVALTETLAAFLMGVVLLATTALMQAPLLTGRPAIMWAVVLGAAGGASMLVRPVAALWLLVPLAAVALVRHRDRAVAVRVVAAALVPMVLLMGAWVVRNALSLGSFVPLTTSASTPLLDSIGGATFTPAEDEIMKLAEQNGEDPIRAVAVARLRDKWRADPAAFIGWKSGELWNGVSKPAILPIDILVDLQSSPPAPGTFADPGGFLPIESDAFYNRLISLLVTYQRALLVLAAIGLFLGRRQPITWVLMTAPVYYAVVHTIILFQVRYFYPAVPSLILLAALGLFGMWQAAARRLRRSNVIAAV